MPTVSWWVIDRAVHKLPMKWSSIYWADSSWDSPSRSFLLLIIFRLIPAISCLPNPLDVLCILRQTAGTIELKFDG